MRPGITRQKQATEGSVGIHLYLEGAVHHCGEGMGSQSVRELITCVCSREAERDERWCPLTFSILLGLGSQPVGWCCELQRGSPSSDTSLWKRPQSTYLLGNSKSMMKMNHVPWVLL